MDQHSSTLGSLHDGTFNIFANSIRILWKESKFFVAQSTIGFGLPINTVGGITNYWVPKGSKMYIELVSSA
jgi:hypothetical protein